MHHKYYIYGKHASIAALRNANRKIYNIICTQNVYLEYQNLIGNFSYNILDSNTITKTLLSYDNKNSKNQSKDSINHQNIAVLVRSKTFTSVQELNLEDPNYKIAILDQITDTHNIGSIIRSAAFFNINAIIMQDANSPQENSIIAKNASGGLELIDICKVVNISQTIIKLKKEGFWIIGLDVDGQSNINSNLLTGKVAIILGSEGKGMRNLTKKNCDFLLSINNNSNFENKSINSIHPQVFNSTHNDPILDSLNVSNAASIAFYIISQNNQSTIPK